MTKNEFEAWVDKAYHDFLRSNRHVYQIFERIVVVVDRKTGKTATAKCHNDDKFDVNTGIAIAFARIKGWEVPEIDEVVLLKPRDGETFFTATLDNHVATRIANKYSCNSSGLNVFMSECAAKATAAKFRNILLLERIHEAVCPDYGLSWDEVPFEIESRFNHTRDTSVLPCTIIRKKGKWQAILATWYSPVETIFPPNIVDKVVAFLNKNYACF